jgi:6-methylsalicylate decarboxylase
MAPKGWLDIHTHFFTFGSDDERATAWEDMGKACFMIDDNWKWSLEGSLAYQDRAGVQMQMLSYLPQTLEKLKAANDYAVSIVKKHPNRFGHLCAIPTDQPEECLKEIERAQRDLYPDGFAVSATYKNVMLSDGSLEPVWARLDAMEAVVFSHPNAYAPARDGRPSPLIEVAFETCRVIVEMLYRGVFKRYPKIKFVFSHCGGVTPILAGRLELLGAESWVPNPEGLTSEDIRAQLRSIWVDCAATAETGLQPAVKMVGPEHVVYGADCGVPCSSEETMEKNRKAIVQVSSELSMGPDTVGRNGWHLFPKAAARVEKGQTNGA